MNLETVEADHRVRVPRATGGNDCLILVSRVSLYVAPFALQIFVLFRRIYKYHINFYELHC
jgi:hypothetical protein